MFEPLSIERVPSRIQKDSVCVAFAMHPNPSSPSACWGSCTITNNINLVFHRPADGMWSHMRIPGACEKKKKTPHFFRFACADASLLLGNRLKPENVVGYSFSETSAETVVSGGGTAAVSTTAAAAAQRGLPTVALLICLFNTETNLLILHPMLQIDGKNSIVCYRAMLLPAPDGVRHVVVSRGGDAALVLEQYVSKHAGQTQCYSLRINGDRHLPPLFRSVHLVAPAPHGMATAAGGDFQRVIWVAARRPLRRIAATLSHRADMEVMVLTDCAVAMVFHLSVDDAGAHDTACIWVTHCVAQIARRNILREPLTVLQRWNTTSSFAQAVESGRHTLEPYSNNTTVFLQRFLSCTQIVRASPNGAVLCVVLPSAHEAFIVGLGADSDASLAAHASFRVMTPFHVRIHDALWVSGSVCGFLLLGTSEHKEPATMLYFLPLTGHPPLRVYVEEAHLVSFLAEGNLCSFFVPGLVQDTLGTSQLRISLRSCRHSRGKKRQGVEEGAGDSGNGGDLRTILVSLPTVSSALQLQDPSHVFHMIIFTGLASFFAFHDAAAIGSTSTSTATVLDSNTIRYGTQKIPFFPKNDGDNEFDVQLATEAALELRLDPWLGVGSLSTIFPLRDALLEVLPKLLEGIQRNSVVGEDHENSAVASLLAVFHSVALVLESLAIICLPTTLLHEFSDIHGVLVMLRQALRSLGQGGAISACFTAATFFANAPRTSSSVEWRAVTAPLFDDAFALTINFPSLSHALLPYCSAPVRCMMETGERVAQRLRRQEYTTIVPLATVDKSGEVIRSLEEVLSLARRGPSGLALLSTADVCSTTHRLFLREGIEATCSFLANILANHNRRCSSEVRNLRVEYDMVQKNVAAVLCQI